MDKKYQTEIREVFGKNYLKVFLKNLKDISDVQTALDRLPSVAKVNVSQSTSKFELPENLTVYSKKLFTIEEMKAEVEIELECFYRRGTSDPKFVDVIPPALGDGAYWEILDKLIMVGNGLEKYPEVADALGEECIRDYFLPFLNSISPNCNATGETFNRKGRTDILIQDNEGTNVFIAECKLWKGSSYLNDGIDQLLGRYISWRDEKAALLVFNKNTSGFSDMITKAVDVVTNHPNCLTMVRKRKETSFSFLFKNTEGTERKINLELVLFNFK